VPSLLMAGASLESDSPAAVVVSEQNRNLKTQLQYQHGSENDSEVFPHRNDLLDKFLLTDGERFFPRQEDVKIQYYVL